MGILRKLGIAKVTEQLARAIIGDTANNLVATGSTQATAYRLEYDVNVFTSVPASSGCILSATSSDGDEITVVNDTPQALSVYPPVGETINQEAVNVPATVTFGSSVFKKVDQTKWRIVSSSSFSTTPSSSGTVSGPLSSTDNAVVRWDGTDGTTIQNSTTLILDAGHISMWSLSGIANEARYIGISDNSTAFSPGSSNGCWISFNHGAIDNQQSILFYTAGTGFNGGFATRRGVIDSNGFCGFGGTGSPSYGLHALSTFGASGAAEFSSVATFTGAIRLASVDFGFSNTISANTNLARVTDTSSAWTMTLPAAAAAQYRVIRIIDASGAAGTNNITIDADGAELINGAANYVIRTNHGGVSVRSDGSNWQIIDEQQYGPVSGAAASANDLTLIPNAALVTISGTTEIQRITNTSWFTGASCKLLFSSTPTVKHDQAVTGGFSKIIVDGNADYVPTAGSVADLFFNGTNFYLRPYYTA